jgi:O-methyltransferase involved in polyketide biosynthesis
VLDPDWLDRIRPASDTAYLFLAEGVLPYFHVHQVKDLVLRVRDRHPGSQLVFDALSPFMVGFEKLSTGLKKAASQLHWAIRDDRELERWGEGIRFLANWTYFSRPEPRLGRVRWMRYFPPLARGARVLRYRLGGND